MKKSSLRPAFPRHRLFRVLLRLLGGCLLSAAPFLAPAIASPEFAEVDRMVWPTGTQTEGVTIGGLSAIAYDPRSGNTWALSDRKGPGEARLFKISLGIDENGQWSAEIRPGPSLRQSDGSLFAALDAEGLAIDGQRGFWYVSTEGLPQQNHSLQRFPWVGQFLYPEAKMRRTLPLPDDFIPRNAAGEPVDPGAPDQAFGVQRNLGFEGLGLTPSGEVLYAANEAALRQDDERLFDFTFFQAQNSLVRLVRWEGLPERPRLAGMRAYRTDPGHRLLGLRLFNTVSALEPDGDDGRVLILERGVRGASLATGNFRLRLYAVDFFDPGATVIREGMALREESIQALSKTLLWEGTEAMDNGEGLSWGPVVDGRRTLLIITDNNSNPQQETQLIILQERSGRSAPEQ